jgi:hypothetical protein
MRYKADSEGRSSSNARSVLVMWSGSVSERFRTIGTELISNRQ